MKLEKNTIYIFADGGCRGNQEKENLGGYGVALKYNGGSVEFYGAEENTTNNKMELTAAVVGLTKVKNKTKPTVLIMDSAYVINGINTWSKKWKVNGFKDSKGDQIKNIEYWRWILDVIEEYDDIQFVQVKGHADNKDLNHADELANKAMDEYIAKKKAEEE